MLLTKKKNHLRKDVRGTYAPLSLPVTLLLQLFIYSFSNNEFYGLFVSKLLSLNHCVLIIVEKKETIKFCYLRSI